MSGTWRCHMWRRCATTGPDSSRNNPLHRTTLRYMHGVLGPILRAISRCAVAGTTSCRDCGGLQLDCRKLLDGLRRGHEMQQLLDEILYLSRFRHLHLPRRPITGRLF
ncbi:hypothetical protein C8Q76DRAFT_725482 [Earliella scabrosa]|nr:hypothetical protein C8Q76DRAFT_725482 [Earliella scabrosa]